MTSPCSVSLRRASTEPGACPRIARFVGPPPRPSAPPRPWNRVRSTPRSRAALARLAWAWWSRQARAMVRVVEQRTEDRAGVGERVARFEQRDQIEDRRVPGAGIGVAAVTFGHRQARQLVHI